MTSRLPRIAIVGRPNVGKSTLANRMCGSRVSIVEPTEGVTRDRVAVRTRLHTERGTRAIEVIDTGGIGVVDRDDLGPHVEEQVRAALLVADLVLFVVDVRSGLTPLDREVADRLRGFKVPVLLVVNKAEGEQNQWGVDDFRRFGLGGDPIVISAQNGEGLSKLYKEIDFQLPAERDERYDEPQVQLLKVAVVGRRNAGKSTLVNYLAREERVIVSEIPGTTRDAVDVVIERDGKSFTLIDTAGVRKKRSMSDAIEFYSDSRSHKAIRRADVVILLFDVTEPLSGLEKRLAKYVVDHHKPVVLAANKWDKVAAEIIPEDFQKYLLGELPGLLFAPVAFLSAKSGFQVGQMFDLALDLYEQARRRVTTGELNRVLGKALEARAPSRLGHRVRLMYATQADRTPPTFVLFVNDKSLISKAYLRYLENRIREDLPFPEVPVQIILRDRKTVPDSEY